MNILGLISQLIGIKTLRLTILIAQYLFSILAFVESETSGTSSVGSSSST